MKKPRRNHLAAFKARVALEAIQGETTVAEIATHHELGSQCPNRFVYVGNRPLTFIDPPCGFDDEDVTVPAPRPRRFPDCPYRIRGFGVVDCLHNTGALFDHLGLNFYQVSMMQEYLRNLWVHYMEFTGGNYPLPELPQRDPPAQPEPSPPEVAQGECTFSESIAYRRQLAANGKTVANAAVLGVEIAREIRVGSQMIDGTIYQRGFDGKIRTFLVDTQSGAKYLRGRGWVGVGGRIILVYGAVDSGATLSKGIQYGRQDDLFHGGMGVGLLVLGAINPAAGIAGGVTYLVADTSEENEPLDLDSLRSPCDPAYRPLPQ